MRVHIRKKHSTNQFPFPECNKEFQNKIKLKSHITVQTGEHKFRCTEGCSQTFQTLSSRNFHDRRHREVQEYKCHICQEEFMRKKSFTIKKKSKVIDISLLVKKKDHMCHLCPRQFLKERSPGNHMMRHENHLLCKTCGRHF